MNANKKREPLKLFGFCGGYISTGIESVIISQLTYYLTESVQISAAAVGILLLCTRIFDGISDAVAGFIVDKTNTRWGKARPYSLMYIPMWIAMVFIFSVPKVDVKIQIIYVFVLYLIIEAIGRTFIVCIQSVLLKRAVYEEKQVMYLTVGAFCSYLFGLVASVLMPILISVYGSTKNGWTIISLMFAIPCAILGLFQFLFVKEFPNEHASKTKNETVSFKQGLQVLFKNKYVFILSGAFLMNNFSSTASGPCNTYYCKYIIGDVSMLSIAVAIAFCSLVIMPFLPKLQTKFGMMKLIKAGLLISAIGSAARYLFPTNIYFQGICAAFNLGGALPLGTYINLLFIDCMKYSLWRDGVPVEGVISSVSGVATKLGAGLGSAAVGILMGISGYIGGAAVQSPAALGMIKFLYAGMPTVSMLLVLFVLRFYDLDEKMPRIEKELKEKVLS